MVTRRKFLQGSAGLTGALALGSTGRVLSAEDVLNILCWEGYNIESLLDPFRKAHSLKVNTKAATSDPAMINKLRAGGKEVWDLINVNQPWAQKVMYPEHLIQPLERSRFEPYFNKYLPKFQEYPLAYDRTGEHLLGMPQRFGPFSFVVNTKKISRETAEDEGWNLFFDKKMKGRYGVLTYPNWNLMHISLAAGLNPWKKMDASELEQFRKTATRIFANAKMRAGAAARLNMNLLNGTIDAYFTGGTWTASPPRMDGFLNIRGITPKSGPVNGKGGVVWVELTSTVNNPNLSPAAPQFLEYVQKPKAAKKVAFAAGTYNPVTQMGNPECLNLFSKHELETIQWDSLEEELARCNSYNIVDSYNDLVSVYNEARRA